MEIEFDSAENPFATYLAILMIVALVVVGLASFGQRVTPVDAMGQPKVISWSDWRMFQARKAYSAEIAVLRSDAQEIAVMLETYPDPVAAQVLKARVKRHTATGVSELTVQRAALNDAALALESWSMGLLDRESAIATLQTAAEFLR